jgi:hypothetical protein
MAQQPQWVRATLLSRIHDHTQTNHTRWDSSGRVISSSQRPLPDNTQHSQETNSTPSVGIEPTIPASEQVLTHLLDHAVTGIGWYVLSFILAQRPHWTRASSFKMFQNKKQRHPTLGKTPLGKWAAQRRDHYLTTHNTHKRHTSMPRWDSKP